MNYVVAMSNVIKLRGFGQAHHGKRVGGPYHSVRSRAGHAKSPVKAYAYALIQIYLKK